MTMRSPGMRLAIAGGAIFLLSAIALVTFLPKGVGVTGLVIGGVGVWSGFVWTIYEFYTTPRPPEPPV